MTPNLATCTQWDARIVHAHFVDTWQFGNVRHSLDNRMSLPPMCIQFNIPGGASSLFSSCCRGRIREYIHGNFICLSNMFACAKRCCLSLSQAVARSDESCNVQLGLLNVVGFIVVRSLSIQIVSLVMYSELCALLSCGIMHVSLGVLVI